MFRVFFSCVRARVWYLHFHVNKPINISGFIYVEIWYGHWMSASRAHFIHMVYVTHKEWHDTSNWGKKIPFCSVWSSKCDGDDDDLPVFVLCHNTIFRHSVHCQLPTKYVPLPTHYPPQSACVHCELVNSMQATIETDEFCFAVFFFFFHFQMKKNGWYVLFFVLGCFWIAVMTHLNEKKPPFICI